MSVSGLSMVILDDRIASGTEPQSAQSGVMASSIDDGVRL
jgi:hypothetical protein